LKRTHLVAGIFIILAFSFLVEYYAENRFPTKELSITGLSLFPLGETQIFDYFWKMENVGTHSYVVTEVSEGLFSMISITEVSNEGKNLLMEGDFIFDTEFNPESYELNVDQDGETTLITVEFLDLNVTSSVTIGEETILMSDLFPKNAFLVENNMPGFWEILLLSADLERGSRYEANAYVPQGGAVFELEFFVYNDLQTNKVGSRQLDCLVIGESFLELTFYFFDNELVQMRNEEQDTLLEKRIN
jgi:hypothetical protein